MHSMSSANELGVHLYKCSFPTQGLYETFPPKKLCLSPFKFNDAQPELAVAHPVCNHPFRCGSAKSRISGVPFPKTTLPCTAQPSKSRLAPCYVFPPESIRNVNLSGLHRACQVFPQCFIGGASASSIKVASCLL